MGDLDVLIIDTPPGTGDVQLTISQKIDVTGAIVVTTPQELSLIDVKRGINMFKKVKLPILGLVENMSYYTCSDCNKKHYIFGKQTHRELAEKFDIKVLGELPISEKLSGNYHFDNKFINDNPNDVLSKSFLEIAKKVLNKIKN